LNFRNSGQSAVGGVGRQAPQVPDLTINSVSFGEFGKTQASNVFRAMLVDGARAGNGAGLIRKSLFGTGVLVIRGGGLSGFKK